MKCPACDPQNDISDSSAAHFKDLPPGISWIGVFAGYVFLYGGFIGTPKKNTDSIPPFFARQYQEHQHALAHRRLWHRHSGQPNKTEAKGKTAGRSLVDLIDSFYGLDSSLLSGRQTYNQNSVAPWHWLACAIEFLGSGKEGATRGVFFTWRFGL